MTRWEVPHRQPLGSFFQHIPGENSVPTVNKSVMHGLPRFTKYTANRPGRKHTLISNRNIYRQSITEKPKEERLNRGRYTHHFYRHILTRPTWGIRTIERFLEQNVNEIWWEFPFCYRGEEFAFFLHCTAHPVQAHLSNNNDTEVPGKKCQWNLGRASF